MVQGALEEYFGMVSDGLIQAARMSKGYWARKTRLPQNMLDVMSYKAQHTLPTRVQQLCDDANAKGWQYGGDQFWDCN